MHQNLDDDLLEKVGDNRYILVNFAAQRARQINEGVVTYSEGESDHPLDVALAEIRDGRITFRLETPAQPEEEERDLEMFALDEMSEMDLVGDAEDFDLEPLDLEDDAPEAEGGDSE